MSATPARSKAVWGDTQPRRTFLQRLTAGLALIAVPTVAAAKAATAEATPVSTPDPFTPYFREAFQALSLDSQVLMINLAYGLTPDGRAEARGVPRDEWGPMHPHALYTAEQLPVAVQDHRDGLAECEARKAGEREKAQQRAAERGRIA